MMVMAIGIEKGAFVVLQRTKSRKERAVRNRNMY